MRAGTRALRSERTCEARSLIPVLEAMDHGGGRFDDASRYAEIDCSENFAHGAR